MHDEGRDNHEKGIPFQDATVETITIPSQQPRLQGTTAPKSQHHLHGIHTGAYIVNATKTGYLENMGSLKLASAYGDLEITLKKFSGIPGYTVASIVADQYEF